MFNATPKTTTVCCNQELVTRRPTTAEDFVQRPQTKKECRVLGRCAGGASKKRFGGTNCLIIRVTRIPEDGSLHNHCGEDLKSYK
jgi:hypothetical protein